MLGPLCRSSDAAFCQHERHSVTTNTAALTLCSTLQQCYRRKLSQYHYTQNVIDNSSLRPTWVADANTFYFTPVVYYGRPM